MVKDVMLIPPEEFRNLVPSERAMDAYRWALGLAGVEMGEDDLPEFVSTRNAKTAGFTELAEVQKWFEKSAASIKEILKHTYNVGTEEELPANVKWAKQSYTYEWREGAGALVANALVKKGLVTKDALLNLVGPSALAKACGMTVDKVMDMYPDTIVEKPKERTLKIK